MNDIIYQEVSTSNQKVKVGILIYRGADDPAKHLNAAVRAYVGREGYNEFIDANMDNPWIRVIIKGINDMEQVEFDPEQHRL
jgi:hypothetical protein